MFDLFSDIFTYRDNALTRIDPRVKLLIALAALIAVVTSARPVLPLAVFVLCLGTIAALRIPAKLVALRLAAPFSTVAILVVIQTFVTGTTPHDLEWSTRTFRNALDAITAPENSPAPA
ncbi:MAG: CbiQ family ECF transporter T component [Thermodesulfobacteriota bacterium]